ncbi:aldehyde-activating protein [Vibrio sp. dsl-7]|uniref:Aldehyde-activating protein n=1 Tax=Vibrio chanodichtyis TaxID=3027932 RepID=A0ABT5UXC3_9VIBR|nr:aldehyde-activating protein [Vibrio chanodichtyis]MDE1514088.1 aldehyde-activating protein [Vibrio chanodichtyis]
MSVFPQEIGECNCSICRRYAAAWAYFVPEQVQINVNEKTTFYYWGNKEVEFHRCNSCGCLTHYVTTEKCSEDILAVNMRMAENEVLSSIPVRKINGASY